jgi:hypothetical protein
MSASCSPGGPPQHETGHEQLAAVLLHVLVSASREQLTLEQAIRACERDPHSTHDRALVAATLREMVDDGLVCHGDDRFRATRAAIRADQLSF